MTAADNSIADISRLTQGYRGWRELRLRRLSGMAAAKCGAYAAGNRASNIASIPWQYFANRPPHRRRRLFSARGHHVAWR